MEPVVARQTWRTLEPIHGMVYFAQEPKECYAAIGVTNDRMGYFASRSAPMGAVPADVVIATFFNFNPDLIRRVIPAAWDITTPQQILAARLDGADRALRRAMGDGIGNPEVKEAAGLARQAAEKACQHPEGRPLFAGHAELPWPDEPHLVLWHAQSLLREYRGDAHVAALLLDGLTGIEALLIHGATGDVPPAALQSSRAWPDDAWANAVAGLHARGWVSKDGTELTDEGREHRRWVEDRTDALSVGPYEVLGEDGCSRLRQLARPVSKAIVEGGLLNA
jgi:hypothetical protein